MTNLAKKRALDSEFDAFLFAPIGEENNGMLLSVLSALARLDIDPWREAAELSRMPKGAANRRVMSLIAGLEIASPTPLEPETVAARLVALLPSVFVSPASSAALLAGGVVMGPRSVLYAVLFSLLLVVAMAGAQWTVARNDQPVKRGSPQTVSEIAKPKLPPRASQCCSTD
jgi:hypothetical protein